VTDTDPEPSYKRKLIEVALPLDDINREAAREKSIRHGHPSTLHLWWARRPLAAARAVLFAQLVDDPSAHPDKYPTSEAEQAERERLFDIIRELVKWENSNNEIVLARARKEIWESCDGNPPPILDPFAGGGTIPLEAQRLGLAAQASDLNPVAVLINKALIEIPPKWADRPPIHPEAEIRSEWRGAEGLAEDVRRYGKWMRDEAEKRIGHLYPKAKLPDGTLANVIAWIWARTVTCPNPACGGTMPLVRSFWLGKKKGKERYLYPIPNGKEVRFEIRGPEGTPRPGTVDRTGAECLLCGSAVPLAYIRDEGKARRMNAQLIAIAAEGSRQRYYLPSTEEHQHAANVLRPDSIPEAELPEQALGFRVQGYGMTTWADLFTNRQISALKTFNDLVLEVHHGIRADGEKSGVLLGSSSEYADAVVTYLGLSTVRIIDRHTCISTWDASPSKEQVRGVFARQTVAMVWDFAEANFFGNSSGNLAESSEWIGQVVERLGRMAPGSAAQSSALDRNYSGVLISTDPPYYDNVAYADLSDLFYVWLRRALRGIYPDLVDTLLTPKSDELVADPFRRGNRRAANEFFEQGFARVFARIQEHAPESYPITVFYAFKQAESNDGGDSSTGWETLLEGMIRSQWTVTATWPMRTELGNRMRGLDSNALASSVVLACRPRGESAPATDRRGFLNELRLEMPDALKVLQDGNIAPVDLAQAAIGPGMQVFSRYRLVSEPDGSPMRVKRALQLINQVLDEVLAEQEGDFDTDSRWCVKWFDEKEWDQGEYGRAETLATARNTSISGLERAGVLKARAGKVWLLKPEDLPRGWDPVTDVRPTIWEAVMHLSSRLENSSIEAAGQLMARIDPVLDLDAVKELAYLLFNICERKRRQDTALMFNSLVTSWPDIVTASREATIATAGDQLTMGFDEE
jgi:putative DNA methylase